MSCQLRGALHRHDPEYHQPLYADGPEGRALIKARTVLKGNAHSVLTFMLPPSQCWFYSISVCVILTCPQDQPLLYFWFMLLYLSSQQQCGKQCFCQKLSFHYAPSLICIIAIVHICKSIQAVYVTLDVELLGLRVFFLN